MAEPKVILFDIGGVCVVSPLGAIADYETKNGIPKDYINFAISHSAPNGAWQRLERGEIDMNEDFFENFKRDLHNPTHWEQYHLFFKHSRSKKSLKQLAGAKVTQLGDPISLKAETSETFPTPDEKGAPQPPTRRRRSFKEVANKTMLGDPVSLKAEKADKGPMPDDSGAPPTKAPVSGYGEPASSNSLKQSYSRNMLGDPTSLQNETVYQGPASVSGGAARSSNTVQAGTSENTLNGSSARRILGDPTSLKNEGSSSDPLPDQQDTGLWKPEMDSSRALAPGVPPLPTIDSTALFWDMMARGRSPDPNVFPALLALRQSKKFIVAALSNTVIFPEDHEYSKAGSRDIQSHFDLFVSSAHIGLRKPDPKIYEYTLDKLNRYDRGRGGDGIRPDQVVFLDDIGSNLKPAQALGFRTIKVNLGHTDKAVTELENIIGFKLTNGEKSRL